MLQARLSIIDLLLIGLDKPAPSLSHFLLGFDLKKQPSVGVPGVARSVLPYLSLPNIYLKKAIILLFFFCPMSGRPCTPREGFWGPSAPRCTPSSGSFARRQEGATRRPRSLLDRSSARRLTGLYTVRGVNLFLKFCSTGYGYGPN